jgi:hypothetical protein
MLDLRTTALAVGLCLLILAGRLPAQIDYRNLDDDRPVATEDAYPLERHAFEVLVPYRFAREQGGERVHLFPVEVEYGAFDNAQLGIAAPIAAVDVGPGSDTDWGLAGLRPFALYNFNTEGTSLPALSLRGDLGLPVGSLAGDNARFELKAIATRSWGLTRIHLNAARSFGSEDNLGAADVAPRWSYSLAADRTLFRKSTLLVGELVASRDVRGDPTAVIGSLGARYQWTATTVVDVGLSRRLSSRVGPDYAVTFGLSHAFGLGWLMPVSPR